MHDKKINNNPANSKNNVVKNVGGKIASGAMQASGVPKPIANFAGKTAANMANNFNPLKGLNSLGKGTNPVKKPNVTPRPINSGLKSAHNNKPSLKNNNKIGKGSHPSQTSSSHGKNTGVQGQKNIGNSTNSGSGSSLGNGTGLKSKNDIDNNNDNSSNNNPNISSSDKLKDGAKNLLGFGGSKPSNDAPASVQLGYRLRMIARVFELLVPIMPIIFFLLLMLVVPFFVMAQVMLIRDKINTALITVTTGIERFVTYGADGAWQTKEEEFYKTLDEKYTEALTLESRDGDVLYLDIPLIASTINYSKVSDIGVYEDKTGQNLGDQSDGSAEGIIGNFFESYMKTRQMSNFYYVANDKLGNYLSLIPGNRRLLGHMINYEVQWETVNIFQAIGMWVEFFKKFAEAINNDVEELLHIKVGFLDYATGAAGLKVIFGAIQMLKTMQAYDSLGITHDSYFEYHKRNILYEWEELIYKCGKFVNSGISTNYSESDFEDEDNAPFAFFPAPKVVFYQTTDMYKPYEYGHYLRKVYIPGTFFSNINNYEPATSDTMLREIYQQKKYYLYLVGDIGNPGTGASGDNCNTNCTYNLSKINTGSATMSPGNDYQNMNNIKVKLVAWYNKSKRGKTMAEGIDFEKYVLGVVYAEVGETFPDEALKSEAVAARSYALTRPFAMGNQSYCNYKKEGDGWVLTLRGSTADQVYCDPDQGCSSDSSSVNNQDIYPGLGHGTDYKKPLDKTSDKGEKIKAAVTATNGQVLVDSNGNVTLASYLDTDQNKWRDRAKKGEKYTTIIPSHYTSKYGHTVSLGDGNCEKNDSEECSSGGASSGEWSNWRQGDSSWGSVPLGNSDIRNIGCAATSIAIQLARSGVKVTFDNLNPGTFVKAYQKAGGFAGGNIFFDQVHKVAPNFKYGGRIGLSGSQSSKAAKIKEYVDKGYYLVMEVKKGNGTGQHWVAVISSDGKNVKMADPASSETDVSSKYSSSGWSEFIYYKKTE